MLLVVCFLMTVLGVLADPSTVVTEWYKSYNNYICREYSFGYKLSDGTFRYQSGDAPTRVTRGGYTYYDDKNKLQSVCFIADWYSGYQVVNCDEPPHLIEMKWIDDISKKLADWKEKERKYLERKDFVCVAGYAVRLASASVG